MATLVTGVPDTRTVNGKPLSSDVTLTATDVGAEPSGTSSAAITQHEAKAGAHSIAGVNGLQAALDNKEASGAATAAIAAHKSGTGQHSIAGVTGLQAALDSKEVSGTASGLVTPLAARVTALEGISQFSRYRFSPSGVSGSAVVSGLGHIYVTDIDGVGTTMTIDTNASTGGVVIPQTGRYRLSLEIMTAAGSGGGSFDFTKSGTLIRTNSLKRPGIGSGSNLLYTTSIEANLTAGDKISFRAVDSALYYANAHWYFDVIRVA